MCENCRPALAPPSLAPRVPRGLSRRSLLGLVAASSAALALGDAASAKDTSPAKSPPKPQNVLTPDAALARLMAGNARYVSGVSKRHDFAHEREALAGGQNPFAAVLGCADSRIAPEYAFDTARGDLFVCRVAGNFANDESVASLEYAVAVLNTPLILVLGHDACGAIDATIKAVKDGTTLPGHLPSLVTALSGAVKTSAQQQGNPLDNAIKQNVLDTVAKLKGATPILSAAVGDNKLKVVGGIYRLRDGRVDMVG